MKPETLKLCIAEAKRFIEKAEQVPTHDTVIETTRSKRTATYINAGKASGAARRASLDLTRCLADLRQGR